MATIRVHREYGAPLVARMGVHVDDVLVARLRSDSSVDVAVGSGRHTVRVVLGFRASAPVQVDLQPER